MMKNTPDAVPQFRTETLYIDDLLDIYSGEKRYAFG